jgi:hypothetical protein
VDTTEVQARDVAIERLCDLEEKATAAIMDYASAIGALAELVPWARVEAIEPAGRKATDAIAEFLAAADDARVLVGGRGR